MRRVAGVGMRVLGSSVVAGAARAATRRGVRILAYHGVPNEDSFDKQMSHLVQAYKPVSGLEVLNALSSGARLPDAAVWVTFDDGRPDVVENALPSLRRWNVPATLFVVASVIDTETPFWWEIVDRTLESGLVADQSLLRRLKAAPDNERRAEIDRLTEQLQSNDQTVTARQLTSSNLRKWLVAGMEVGNHSWDHPCLDKCAPNAQIDQIRSAHDKLSALIGDSVRLFAYPNGDFSTTVDDELKRLDYGVGCLFDHRMANTKQNPLALSRFRIDSRAELPRFRAIVSGAHSALFAGKQRATALLRR